MSRAFRFFHALGKGKWVPIVFLLAALVVVTAVTLKLLLSAPQPLRCARGQGEACTPTHAIFLDTTKSADQRATDLMSYMTLDEKIGQMALVEKNSVSSLGDIAQYGLGALLSGAGGKPTDNSPQGWRTMIDQFEAAALRSRLGIPLLYGLDANHGNANVPGATVFPHEVALGAINDPDLVTRIAQATTQEMHATEANWNFMPSLDAPLDPRWGRTYEAFSSDPQENATLGAAFVTGTREASSSVLTTAKHFVGAGSMQWGTSNNTNFHIDQGRTPANEDTLQHEYLPPFAAAIKAGVGSVMVGLNQWGDTYAAADYHLLTDVLKNQLPFKGFVVSDWYGVYMIPGGNYQATVQAVNAGVDMVMLPFDYVSFVRDMKRAVENGDILTVRLDDAVHRILAVKFQLGLFDQRSAPLPLSVIGSADHRALARQAVARSQVLLKNNGVLPIASSVHRIVVGGSAADNIGRQAGAWTVEWQGIDGNWLPGATSILQGIREDAGPSVNVTYQASGQFASGTEADIGIAVVGEKPYAEGWGDNANPVLSAQDLQTIAHLRAVSRRVIVVIVSGRPLLVTDQLPHWDGLVEAWLPGSEGAGVADALFGRTAMQARLPVAWPTNEADLGQPNVVPLFPRGYGLQTRVTH